MIHNLEDRLDKESKKILNQIEKSGKDNNVKNKIVSARQKAYNKKLNDLAEEYMAEEYLLDKKYAIGDSSFKRILTYKILACDYKSKKDKCADLMCLYSDKFPKKILLFGVIGAGAGYYFLHEPVWNFIKDTANSVVNLIDKL